MDACRPLAKEGRLMAYRHRGFWQPADTVKERHALEAAYHAGDRPWMVWEPGPAADQDDRPGLADRVPTPRALATGPGRNGALIRA